MQEIDYQIFSFWAIPTMMGRFSHFGRRVLDWQRKSASGHAVLRCKSSIGKAVIGQKTAKVGFVRRL